MAQPDTRSPQAVGPIRDPEARRVCTLSGIALAQQKVVEIKNLREGLDRCIRDLENQKRTEQIAKKALLVARFTKASCDTFLGIAAALSKVLLPKGVGKQADLVDNVYGTVTPLAEAAATSLAGGKADWVGKTASAAKSAVSVFTDSEAVEISTKLAVAEVEVVNSAMNQDEKGVITTAATYLYDLHTTIGEMIGWKKTATFAKIAESAFNYNEELGKAFDEMLESTNEANERYSVLKTNLLIQAKNISKRIVEMEELIRSCETELGSDGVT